MISNTGITQHQLHTNAMSTSAGIGHLSGNGPSVARAEGEYYDPSESNASSVEKRNHFEAESHEEYEDSNE